MKLVLLCGGLGTRLREETEFRPKPMVMVGERPILWHIMKHYAHYGVREFIVCLGYRGDIIKDYFYNYHLRSNDFTVTLTSPPKFELHGKQDESDWKVTLIDTGLDAQTGARIKRIQPYVGDQAFLMTYGDGVSNIDIQKLVDYHREHHLKATVTAVNPPARFGELLVENGRALEFAEKPQTQTGFISGGFFVLEPSVFDYLTDDDSCSFERGPLAQLASDKQLAVYAHEGFWQCMDTYRDYTLLNELWASGQAPWKVY